MKASADGSAWAGRSLGIYPISLGLAVLTCVLTPAYVIRWRFGIFPTTLLEIAILLTVVAFAYESWRLRSIPLLRSPFTVPAVIFIVAGAISVIAAPDRRAALGIYRAYLIEPIAFFFVLSVVVNSYKRALLMLGGLGVAGVVVGVANSAVVLDAIRHHTWKPAGTPAVTAPVVIYTNANAVALFLVPLIAVAGSLVLHETNPRIRLASLAFVLIAVASTLFSFSRGGDLALPGGALG